MKCLRIYAPRMVSFISVMLIFPRRQCLFFLMKPRSSHYPASRIRFVHVPAGVREAGWHIPPGRVLAVWLDGIVEFETSDGETRRVSAGNAVLVEDTHGKGHIASNRISCFLPPAKSSGASR